MVSSSKDANWCSQTSRHNFSPELNKQAPALNSMAVMLGNGNEQRHCKWSPPPPTPTVCLICRHLSCDFAQQLSIPVNISTFDPMDEEAAPLSFPVCGFFQDKLNSLTSLPECRNVFEALRKWRTIIRIPQIRILQLQITSRLID